MNDIVLINELSDVIPYMSWLNEFTSRKGSFSTESFSERENEISINEGFGITQLERLYDCIENYAHSNYLDPTIVEDGMFYSVQFQGTGYYIGFDYSNDSSSFYCTRLDEVEEDSLDITDIVENKRSAYALDVDSKLQKVCDYIEEMSSEGIPIRAVEDATALEFKKIRRKRYGERD